MFAVTEADAAAIRTAFHEDGELGGMSVILISYQNDRLLSEAAVAAIRAIFEDEGDLRAAVEARGSFPGVSDRREAWAHERIVAGWQLPPLSCPR
jgi:hypothetical protein